MVVCVIIVVISGVVTLAMQPALRDARMRSACRIIASKLNYARSFAVSQQNDARVVFTQVEGTRVQRIEVDIPVQQ